MVLTSPFSSFRCRTPFEESSHSEPSFSAVVTIDALISLGSSVITPFKPSLSNVTIFEGLYFEVPINPVGVFASIFIEA